MSSGEVTVAQNKIVEMDNVVWSEVERMSAIYNKIAQNPIVEEIML